MLEIAQRNGLKNKLPFSNVEEARAAYQFHNLQSFLDSYSRCDLARNAFRCD